ncbi:hypothetical protein HHK36_021661 [Tetracentron sinense]|uniref:DYW domain-containing protein n=1 Tax=Tetracentron sinense TaxID=13715 RepID=A0A834YS02_TETSI|nr:hypothetical protein HHK36_021661 [Tetracentron sinense]
MKAKQKLREAVDLLCARGRVGPEAYSQLLLECVRTSDVDQAKRLQSHMELHSFVPTNTFLQNRLLHLYAKLGKISDARRLFDKMPQRDVFSWNALLSAYSKTGSVVDLQALFNQMPVRDSVSYNTIIAGFAGNGCSNTALDFFVRMQREGFEPTEYTHVSVLNACSLLLDLKRGKQIHGRIVVCNLKRNVFVWNSLTDMYAKCGEIDQARFLFDHTVDRNVVSWNSMISGYLKNGQPEKCLDLFREMRLMGVEPDLVTVSSVLGAYFQSGCIEEASRTFSEIKDRDRVCWTTMIVGYTQNGKEEDALLLFGEMLLENVKPDSFTISSVVSACARLAFLDHGKVVHGKAILNGIDCDLLVSSALVDMYSKCGNVADACFVFEMMPTRNVVTWNAMIMGYAQNGQDIEALALYDRMLLENLKPDNITFVGVLSACSHAGLIEYGQRYFHSINDLHGMTPTFDHYACMINLLGRSGYMNEAVDLIKGIPGEPNCLIWSTLLAVSTINGDIEHGEIAARHLFELDSLNSGPYIMLSNMYAASGRWKDVASMRSLMKSRNIRKSAAYSWIDIDNKVHKFVSDDRTHPQTDKIYEELGRLIKKLQEAGFVPRTNLVLHDVGEEEKFESICYHSEKLALAFGLINKPRGGTPIRIMKNIRVCGDCHVFMKFVSKITERHIVLRDSNRFHHFVSGQCSCKDYWKEFAAAIGAKQLTAQEAEQANFFFIENGWQDKKSAVIRAQAAAKSAQLIGQAITNNPAFIILRKIEAARAGAVIILSANGNPGCGAAGLLMLIKDDKARSCDHPLHKQEPRRLNLESTSASYTDVPLRQNFASHMFLFVDETAITDNLHLFNENE